MSGIEWLLIIPLIIFIYIIDRDLFWNLIAVAIVIILIVVIVILPISYAINFADNYIGMQPVEVAENYISRSNYNVAHRISEELPMSCVIGDVLCNELTREMNKRIVWERVRDENSTCSPKDIKIFYYETCINISVLETTHKIRAKVRIRTQKSLLCDAKIKSVYLYDIYFDNQELVGYKDRILVGGIDYNKMVAENAMNPYSYPFRNRR